MCATEKNSEAISPTGTDSGCSERMMAPKSWLSLSALTVALLVATSVPPSRAADGVILINQSKVAAAGGFPYKVTAAGSYQLAGNLTVVAGDGITVSASPVTIDLYGFAISTSTVSASSSAIVGSGGALTVFNGSIIGFGNGVTASGGSLSVRNVTFSKVQLGINSHASAARLTNLSVQGSFGISCFGDCVVMNSTVSAAFNPLTDERGGLVAMNNILTGASGVTTDMASGLILGNIIANAGGSVFTGIDVEEGGVVGFGRNVINTGGTMRCFGGGTSLGNSVCDGTKQ
jgi:hypothetical protein